MKKKNWIQFLKKTLIIFVIVVFSVFSSGVLVSIHECCKAHHHLCCDEHHELEDHEHLAYYNDEYTPQTCSTETENDCEPSVNEEELLADVCACQNHSHCFIVTYLIKITDNFVGSSILKDNIKSPDPINLLVSIINDQLDLSHKNNEPQEVIFSPPTLKLVGSNFINFTSQRVFYA